MSMVDDSQIEYKFIDIMKWMRKNKLKSYDPYDVVASPIYDLFERHKHRNKFLNKYSVYSIERRYPHLSRIICPKLKSQTTSAIYASSCFMMNDLIRDGDICGDDRCDWGDAGIDELEWLIKSKSLPQYEGYSWGLPFVWKMGGDIYAPVGTPYSTLSIYMIDAFKDGYIATDYSHYREVLSNTHYLFTKYLKRFDYGDETTALSYSPLDDFRVVNVQSYAAAAIYETLFDPDQERIDLANRLINYILKEQRPDGSWNYWGSDDNRVESVDSLHQCYIMQNLYRCYCENNDSRIMKSIHHALQFYIKNYFDGDYIRKFPIGKETDVGRYELIDVVEAMRLFLMLHDDSHVEFCINSIFKNFNIVGKPYFMSTLKDDQGNIPSDDIPYMRWGQVQAAYSMGRYLWQKNY